MRWRPWPSACSCWNTPAHSSACSTATEVVQISDVRSMAHALRWRDVYSEAELYKAALRVYTKPLFHWRKALATSTDGKTLYDLAGRGLRSLDAIHRSLE